MYLAVILASIPIALFFLFYTVAPAFAREVANKSGSKLKEKMAAKSGKVAAKSGKVAAATAKKSPSFIRKVLDGANSASGSKKFKAGRQSFLLPL